MTYHLKEERIPSLYTFKLSTKTNPYFLFVA